MSQAFKFNIQEAFEIAMQMERNGRDFYRKASVGTEDPSTAKELVALSDMEASHERIFSDMASKYPEPFDLDRETLGYVDLVAAGKVFDLTEDPWTKISADIRSILVYAIGLEKESVIYYEGLKRLVPDELGKGDMDRIIGEELGHIVFLTNKLESYGKEWRSES